MANDALTQTANELGVQTEPSENFFDPAQSQRLMARYAPAAASNVTAGLLAKQAEQQQQYQHQQQQYQHQQQKAAMEQQIWGRQQQQFAEDDQEKLIHGQLLQQMSGISPTIPVHDDQGKPKLGSDGNPIMTTNPEYLNGMAQLEASAPEAFVKSHGFQAIRTAKDAEYSRVETQQARQRSMEEHGLNLKSNYVNRAIDSAVRRGVKPEDITKLPKDEYGLPDPVSVAELQAEAVSGRHETKEQESKRKVQETRDLATIDALDSRNKGSLRIAWSLPPQERVGELEKIHQDNENQYENTILQGNFGRVTPQMLDKMTRGKFINTVAERFQYEDPDAYNGKGYNKDGTKAKLVTGATATQAAIDQLKKVEEDAKNYYDTYMMLKLAKQRAKQDPTSDKNSTPNGTVSSTSEAAPATTPPESDDPYSPENIKIKAANYLKEKAANYLKKKLPTTSK